jgi:glucosamine-6-phosphate deaminase
MMEFITVDDYEDLSRTAADIITVQIAAKPDAAVVPAVGDTPMGAYRELATRRERGELDPTRLRVFQLDAYLGLAPDDPRALYGWLLRSFVAPLGIPLAHVVRLPGDAPDPEAACGAYDAAVTQAGGIDLAILGLGPNGHLGYNEPPADPAAPTRVVDLTEESIVSSARYWGGRERVPRRALTAGMAPLLAARHTLLLVSGAHKREILRRTLSAPPTPAVPASYLQLAPRVTVLADRAAWPGAQ